MRTAYAQGSRHIRSGRRPRFGQLRHHPSGMLPTAVRRRTYSQGITKRQYVKTPSDGKINYIRAITFKRTKTQKKRRLRLFSCKNKQFQNTMCVIVFYKSTFFVIIWLFIPSAASSRHLQNYHTIVMRQLQTTGTLPGDPSTALRMT